MANISATGYVHTMLDKEQTFNEFALSCARAFGALITMRDDPQDANIPEVFAYEDYYAESHRKAAIEVQRLESLTSAERVKEGENIKAESINLYRKSMLDTQDEIARCKGMLAKVTEWDAPTPEHEGLKKFMVEQLTISIGDDGKYWRERIAEDEGKEPMIFFVDRLASARRMLEISKESLDNHIKAVDGRNAWVKALRESLAKERP